MKKGEKDKKWESERERERKKKYIKTAFVHLSRWPSVKINKVFRDTRLFTVATCEILQTKNVRETSWPTWLFDSIFLHNSRSNGVVFIFVVVSFWPLTLKLLSPKHFSHRFLCRGSKNKIIFSVETLYNLNNVPLMFQARRFSQF